MVNDISPIFWFWVPALFFIVQIALEITLSGPLLSVLHSENGPHESLQAILMVLGFGVAFYSFVQVKEKILRGWFLLASLCCFYVAGEEISWGQHIWDWATPDYWNHMNDQQETNLHNISSWLDQKPRLLLLLGVIFGGIIFPFLQKRGILKLPAVLEQLIPSAKLGLIAFLAFVPYMVEKIFEMNELVLFARFSEVQELYMFYFVLLYLLMLRRQAL